MLEKIWQFIEYNRWFVAGVILALAVTLGGIYCVPVTPSPLQPAKMVDEKGLALEFKTWQMQCQVMQDQFTAAGEDLQAQAARNGQIETMIVDLASGRIPDIPSFLQVLLASGGLGAVYDNIRKRGLISGLKIQVKNNANSTTTTTANAGTVGNPTA
jgi:hypothetical protein